MKDHLGFRDPMVQVYSMLRYLARSPTTLDVAFGRDGRLYYAAERTFEQSRGQIFRARPVTDFVETATRLRNLVASRGGRMIVAIPPNPQSVETQHLPRWALRFEGPTEYDYVLESLARREVAALDLRPVLEKGKRVGPVYRPRNTHWTRLGALLAFNAIALELGHRDWVIEPSEVVKGSESDHGDLARMIGVSEIFPDTNTSVDLSRFAPDRVLTETLKDFPNQPSYIATSSRGGETVIVLGDSYSRRFMRDYFTARSGRLIWTHFRNCRFDWSLIEKNLPATVIVMPVERYALCGEGAIP